MKVTNKVRRPRPNEVYERIDEIKNNLDPLDNLTLRNILTKFDNHVYVGSARAYDIFNKFDIDKDGF